MSVAPRLREDANACQPSLSLKVFVLIVAGAFLLRMYWLFAHTALICNEGGEYARTAENILAGRGYFSILGVPQLYFPPLYPLLIALFSLLTRNSELAGRLVSLLAGTCLLLPCAGIAGRLYGRKVAYLCTVLVACHPLLIAFSTSVFSEGLFATLLMSAVYWTMRCLEVHKSRAQLLLAGVFWGLSYLTRPEAIVYAVAAAGMVFVVDLASSRAPKKACLAIAWLILPLLLIGGPYVAYLSRSLGGFHFEAKSNVNYTIAQRLNSGMDAGQAEYGISRDLKQEGPLLNLNLYVPRSPYSKSLGAISRYVAVAARRNKDELYRVILPAASLGSPFLLVLIVLGLLRKAWSLQRSLQEALLLLVVSVTVLILLAAHEVTLRYIFPLLPFFLIWAGNGAHELGDWASSTAALLWPHRPSNTQRLAWILPYGMVAVILLTAALGFSHDRDSFWDDTPEFKTEKNAGLWLRTIEPDARVASSGTAIPYYAGAVWVPFPYADSSLALKYIASKKPDFVVLTALRGLSLPYMENWITHGIPDSRAKLIYESPNGVGEQVFVYSWSSKMAPTPN